MFFDLPVVTGVQRREYTKFRKFLLKSGFLMLQESVYCKIALNGTVTQGIIDSVSSNISSDDYFTRSHQRGLGIVASLGAATISSIWHDKELFPDFLQWYDDY